MGGVRSAALDLTTARQVGARARRRRALRTGRARRPKRRSRNRERSYEKDGETKAARDFVEDLKIERHEIRHQADYGAGSGAPSSSPNGAASLSAFRWGAQNAEIRPARRAQHDETSPRGPATPPWTAGPRIRGPLETERQRAMLARD